MKINLNQLHTFYMVVQCQGIRAAAKKIHVSAPAVSMQMRRLEDWLGFPLLMKNCASFMLTEQAQKILPMVEDIFTKANVLDQVIHTMIQEQQDILRIGVHVTPAEYYMPTLLTILKGAMPLIDIRININNSKEIVEKLRNRELDIGIVGGKFEKDFMYKEFLTSDVVFAVCGKNPLGRDKAISIYDLEDIPMLSYAQYSGFGTHIQQFLQAYGVVPKKTMENMSSTIARKLVPGNIYGGFFDSISIQKELENGTLRIVNIVEKVPPFTLYFACLKGHEQSFDIRYFWDALPTPEEYRAAYHMD